MYIFPHFSCNMGSHYFHSALLNFHRNLSEKCFLESLAHLASRFTVSDTSAFKADNPAYYTLFACRNDFVPTVCIFLELIHSALCFSKFYASDIHVYSSVWVLGLKIFRSSPSFCWVFWNFPATGENLFLEGFAEWVTTDGWLIAACLCLFQ